MTLNLPRRLTEVGQWHGADLLEETARFNRAAAQSLSLLARSPSRAAALDLSCNPRTIALRGPGPARHPERELDSGIGQKVRAARASISAAQRQLDRIRPELCQRFIDLWQADLVEWRRHVSQLPRTW
jgi:hypothetical protein